MRINGAVQAKSDRHAYKILQDLLNDYVLDFFEVDGGTTNISDMDANCDAYVDREGYLTFVEDIPGDKLSTLVYDMPQGYALYTFEADYAR